MIALSSRANAGAWTEVIDCMSPSKITHIVMSYEGGSKEGIANDVYGSFEVSQKMIDGITRTLLVSTDSSFLDDKAYTKDRIVLTQDAHLNSVIRPLEGVVTLTFSVHDSNASNFENKNASGAIIGDPKTFTASKLGEHPDYKFKAHYVGYRFRGSDQTEVFLDCSADYRHP